MGTAFQCVKFVRTMHGNSVWTLQLTWPNNCCRTRGMHIKNHHLRFFLHWPWESASSGPVWHVPALQKTPVGSFWFKAVGINVITNAGRVAASQKITVGYFFAHLYCLLQLSASAALCSCFFDLKNRKWCFLCRESLQHHVALSPVCATSMYICM